MEKWPLQCTAGRSISADYYVCIIMGRARDFLDVVWVVFHITKNYRSGGPPYLFLVILLRYRQRGGYIKRKPERAQGRAQLRGPRRHSRGGAEGVFVVPPLTFPPTVRTSIQYGKCDASWAIGPISGIGKIRE